MKYSQIKNITNTQGQVVEKMQFVNAKDVPLILFTIFVGQKDQKRIDAAELIEKYTGQEQNLILIQ